MKKVFCIINFIMFSALIISYQSCAPKKTPRENVLIFGSSGDVATLDPGDASDGETIQRMDNIFEGLVQFKPGTVEIEPCLATSWEISEDGKELIFNLRKDVKFHDGTDFNADAVVFSMSRMYDNNHPFNKYGKWYYWEWSFADVEKVEKIDDYKVKMALKNVNASIMISLVMTMANIVSPTNHKTYKDEAYKHPCGTGPFKFVEWVKEDHITLQANREYWGEKPKIDKLIFKVIPDGAARLQALEVNEIQGMEYPNPEDFDRIRNNPGLKLMQEPGMNVGYMAINAGYGYADKNKNGIKDQDEEWVKNPGYFEPFTKKEVRKAIQHAIDKQAIVDDIYAGTAIPAINGMPPFLLGYNDEIKDYEYNPQKAKELLAEAGYPDGFEVTLYVMPVSRPYMFDPPKIGEAIKEYLKAVGITVHLYQTEWGAYLDELRSGKPQMCLLGWTGDNGDTDNFLNSLYGANKCAIGSVGNYGFYNDMDAQELLTKALRTYDMGERYEYYSKFQEMIHEHASYVYLAHSVQSIAFRRNVDGFVISPTSRKFFHSVEIKEVHQ
jgi:peptide/nickel transport system substrate-binding protein